MCTSDTGLTPVRAEFTFFIEPCYIFLVMALVRFTKQRKAVLDVVLESKDHLDAFGVHSEVKKYLPKISLATVYRSLETLVGEGWLVALQHPGVSTRFDRREPRHQHFICDACGKIFDIKMQLPNLIRMARKSTAHKTRQPFIIDEVKVEFHGKCKKCVMRA